MPIFPGCGRFVASTGQTGDMPRSPRPTRRLLLAGLSLLLAGAALAGCGAGANAATPTWVPQPAYTLEPGPGLQPPQSAAPAPSAPNAPSAGPTASATTPALDPAVVATGLSAPTGIAVLPDGTALVGERTTGRVLRVQPVAGQPVSTVRTLTGLDTTGGGGLLDLAVAPDYADDGLIFAYLTTPTDNRVVAFTLTGAVTVVIAGIPKGATDNMGRIAFDAQGNLLVGTGDAGQPALAQNPASLAGKVLNVTDAGAPVSGTSPVMTQGHHTVAGLCFDSSTGAIFETEPGSGAVADEVNLLVPGADYGWPTPSAGSKAALATLPAAQAGPGGCAAADGVLYVASLDGKALLAATITATTGSVKLSTFTASLAGTYGRLITVAAAPDGSLWLATSNTDGHGSPTAADERILHIQPTGGGAGSTL